MDKKIYLGWFSLAAIQMLGFYLLWDKISTPQAYVYMPAAGSSETIAGTPTSPVTVTQFPTESALRETAKAVLKQELDPYLRQLAAAPEASIKHKAAPVDFPHVKENSPENLQAAQQANSIIDLALAKKVWTEQDSLALLRYVFNLTSAQRAQLAQKLYGPINRQELQVTGSIPGL